MTTQNAIEENKDDNLKLKKKKKFKNVMERLFQDFQIFMPKVGELIEGTVLGIKSPFLFIDLGPFGTGVVFGREFYETRDIIKNLRIGDKVTVKVLDFEFGEGYVELSLREAGKEIIWREAQTMKAEMTPIELPVLDVNKGGIILEWKGVQGFLPTSQLKTAHYPRVEGGDKDKILDELKKLIGKTLSVVIIDVDPKEDKLIFSEKDVETEELKKAISKYEVGDILEGEITGVMDFGVFVKIDKNLEGLVHISELDWSLVENPADLFKVGDKVKVKIISIENGKISLSIKALKSDPWSEIKDKYHVGDTVIGVVFKFNKYGAYVNIEEGISGLVHISEFGSVEKMKSKLEVGKSYPFKVTVFSPEAHRLAFAPLGENSQ
jgi:small subunit ribosomal protein S1